MKCLNCNQSTGLIPSKKIRNLVFLNVIVLACVLFACKDDPKEDPTLKVEGETTLDVPKEGGVYYVTATSNKEIAVQASQIWCKAEFLKGVSSNNVKITVEPNDGEKRDCEVSIVVYSLDVVKVTISQDGKDIIVTPDEPKITGSWSFDDPANLTKATIGNDLVMYNWGEPSTVGFTSVPGPNGGKAVLVAQHSYFIANHGISANGEGAMVNEYTLLFDYRLPTLGEWFCFLQTDTKNESDGEIFIRPEGTLANSELGWSTNPVPQDDGWHRLVIVCKLPDYYKFYIDGALFHEGKSSALTKDNRYALELAGMMLLGDDDGEAFDMDVAQITVWDAPLSAGEVTALGGAGSYGYLE